MTTGRSAGDASDDAWSNARNTAVAWSNARNTAVETAGNTASSTEAIVAHAKGLLFQKFGLALRAHFRALHFFLSWIFARRRSTANQRARFLATHRADAYG
jgi:hypothetical protein